MSSFQESLQAARANSFYTAAKEAQSQVSAESFQAISEHQIHMQAAKIESLVRNYATDLKERTWSEQMIHGLNQALKKAGVEIVEVHGGETKNAEHSDFFQKKYVRKFEKSEEYIQFSELISTLKETQEEYTEAYCDLFPCDVSAARALIANKLQLEVAKIVVYIEDFFCPSQDRLLHQETLKALDFALQVNGHELKIYDPAQEQEPSDALLKQILLTHKLSKSTSFYSASEDESLAPIIKELKECIQKCCLKSQFDIELFNALEFTEEISDPLFKSYLMSAAAHNSPPTLEKMLEKLEEDLALFNAEIRIQAFEESEENLSSEIISALSNHIRFNIGQLKSLPGKDEDSSFELQTLSEEVLLIPFEAPYVTVLNHSFSESLTLLNQLTLPHSLFDFEAFAKKDTLYLLSYRFLDSILSQLGPLKSISSSQIERAARAHYNKVLEEAKKRDDEHLEQVRAQKEQAKHAQDELKEQQREQVRRQASLDIESQEERRSWFSWPKWPF